MQTGEVFSRAYKLYTKVYFSMVTLGSAKVE